MKRFLLALLLAAPLAAEETGWIRLGETGILKGDLAIALYLDGDPVADPGIVLEEQGAGAGAGLDYRWTSLPNVSANDADTYSLTWTWNDVGYTYAWPTHTRTAMSVLTYTVGSSPVQLAQGATIPAVGLTINGLPSDPDGSTVTFSLWKTQGSVRVLDDVSASVVSSAATGSTWQLVVQHSWTAAETEALSGEHYGRFKVVLPDDAVIFAPPPPGNLGVRIHALP